MEWYSKYDNKTLLLGPCSGESYPQLESVFKYYVENKIPVSFIRVGVWKPRSRPGSFEGMGEQTLEWLQSLTEKYKIKSIVEVANPTQLDTIRKYGIDAFWIGARSSADPFTVQQLADAVAGDDMTIYVKNPVHPDLPLWQGNVERIAASNKGLTGAIHRGFSVYGSNDRYRNRPYWTIPLEFKRLMPEFPLLCDPSHITGNSDMVYDVGQKAFNLSFDGLMLEVHPDPKHALSDAAQQITPEQSEAYLRNWQVYSASSQIGDDLEVLRKNIDTLDAELIELLVSRYQICEDIGKIKNELQIPAYIPERWDYVLKTRTEQARENLLSPEIVKAIYEQIHQLSLSAQNKHLQPQKKDKKL